MRFASRVGSALTLLAFLAVVAGPALGADATVGRFVQRAASELSLLATDGRTAADALRAAGVALPNDLDVSKRLTERDVATIAQALGVRVTTSHPDAPFDTDKIDRFFRSFGAEIGGEIAASTTGDGNGKGKGEGPPFDPFGKGRGKGSSKAKHNRTPIDPD